MINVHKALVLAPHTDDGELGCGGTISRLVASNVEVFYVAFSAAEESVPIGLPKDTLRREAFAATRSLGIKKENCTVLEFRVRHFPSARQEILEKLVSLSKEVNPDLVFVPSRTDTHQDHAVISREGYRAFKRKTIFSYELPWNTRHFDATCLIRLSEVDIENKVLAVSKYQSQVGRDYTASDAIWSLARVRGQQAGYKYAEAFEVQRVVI